MDNEMIERVADKLRVESGLTINIELFWLHLAAVAIKAMREPTEKMLDAGREAMSSCWSLEPGEGLDEAPAPVIWESMIDAIISP